MTLICDAWCRRHYDGTGRCRQSTLLWRRTRGTAMHAVPDDTFEAMATCMASAPNRRTSVTSGKISSRQPLQIPSHTRGTTTRVRTVIQTAARVSRQHFNNVHCTHACNALTLLHCVQTGVGGASSDVEGASTCDHLLSSDITCAIHQASLDNLPQDFGDDDAPQPTPLQLHAILQGTPH